MSQTLSAEAASKFVDMVDRAPLDSQRLHAVVEEVFQAAGCRVFSEFVGAADTPVGRADLIVWHESLDVERGAPIVVEVQARTDAVGALIPRLRRTKHAAGVRTLLALTSGDQRTHVEVDEELGGWIIQAALRSFVTALIDRSLNDTLILLLDERAD
jgi:hypothetical protein